MSGRDEFYENSYTKLLNNGLIGYIGKFVHRQLEPKSLKEKHFDKVLELGAGHGQHLEYVKHSFSTYYETDIRETNLPNRDSSSFNLIQEEVDAQKLPYPDAFFDRVIATCLLAHLDFPEESLREWKRVTKPGGLITIYVSCEPGMILRLGRYLSTVQKARKSGGKHLSIHYREHRNYFIPLNIMIKEVFADSLVDRKFWPVRIPSWNFNIGTIFQIKSEVISE